MIAETAQEHGVARPTLIWCGLYGSCMFIAASPWFFLDLDQCLAISLQASSQAYRLYLVLKSTFSHYVGLLLILCPFRNVLRGVSTFLFSIIHFRKQSIPEVTSFCCVDLVRFFTVNLHSWKLLSVLLRHIT